MRKRNFIVCGLTGMCIEVVFTSACSIKKKDKTLMGHSSVWMFPIYGLASIIGDIYPKIAKWPKLLRAFLYGICFLIVEFISGSILTGFGVCPWSYKGCMFSVKDIIRLDFFPLWMMAGLLYEHILRKGPGGPFLT